MTQELCNEAKKKIVAEYFLLMYYNKTLFEKGLITEEQRNRIVSKINKRKPIENICWLLYSNFHKLEGQNNNRILVWKNGVW